MNKKTMLKSAGHVLLALAFALLSAGINALIAVAIQGRWPMPFVQAFMWVVIFDFYVVRATMGLQWHEQKKVNRALFGWAQTHADSILKIYDHLATHLRLMAARGVIMKGDIDAAQAEQNQRPSPPGTH